MIKLLLGIGSALSILGMMIYLIMLSAYPETLVNETKDVAVTLWYVGIVTIGLLAVIINVTNIKD